MPNVVLLEDDTWPDVATADFTVEEKRPVHEVIFYTIIAPGDWKGSDLPIYIRTIILVDNYSILVFIFLF